MSEWARYCRHCDNVTEHRLIHHCADCWAECFVAPAWWCMMRGHQGEDLPDE